MKNVIVRSISGLVYIAIIVCAILGGWHWFAALTAAFTLLAVIEFEKVASLRFDPAAVVIDSLAALSLAMMPVGLWQSQALGLGIMVGLIVCFLARLTYALFDESELPFAQTARSMLGAVYVGLPLLCLNALYLFPGAIGPGLVLMMFVLIWLNDTGAFCFGSLLGKHRLCERLSPKKSWEGFWGGMVCCLAFGIVSYYTLNPDGLPLVFWLAFGPVVSLFATWGDLFESLIKRSMHVKDSGNLIPGHGGILDRIDSLLFCAPATFLLAVLMLMN